MISVQVLLVKADASTVARLLSSVDSIKFALQLLQAK